jgi:two-component system, OmpR family, KDP operon response regulator KdpE
VTGASVLVVDDEPQILRAVERALSARGYNVRTATDGRGAVGAVAEHEPDLVVLDLNLPHMDGLTACREIRRTSRVPILVLSVREAEQDKVAALDLGADDYLTKPFGTEELLARVRALLRRSAPEAAGERFAAGGVALDVGARMVTRDGEAVHLTPTEWRLLEALSEAPGALRTHEWLLAHVWEDDPPDVEALRVFVSQLRRKIEPDPSRPQLIHTEAGLGYRWTLEPSAGSAGDSG